MSTVPQDIVEQKRQEELKRQRELALAELKKPSGLGMAMGIDFDRRQPITQPELDRLSNRPPKPQEPISTVEPRPEDIAGPTPQPSPEPKFYPALEIPKYQAAVASERARDYRERTEPRPKEYEQLQDINKIPSMAKKLLSEEVLKNEAPSDTLSSGATKTITTFARGGLGAAQTVQNAARNVASVADRYIDNPTTKKIKSQLDADAEFLAKQQKRIDDNFGEAKLPEKVASGVVTGTMLAPAFRSLSAATPNFVFGMLGALDEAGKDKTTPQNVVKAFTKGATLDAVFKGAGAFKPITRAGVVSAATGADALAEGADPSEALERAAVMAGLSLSHGGGGRVGAKEIAGAIKETISKGERYLKGKITPKELGIARDQITKKIQEFNKAGIPREWYADEIPEWYNKDLTLSQIIKLRSRMGKPRPAVEGEYIPPEKAKGVTVQGEVVVEPKYLMPSEFATQPRAGGIAKGMPGSPDWSKSSLTFLKKAQEKPEQVQSGPRLRLTDDVTVKDIHGNKTTFKKGHELSTRIMGGQVLAQDGNDAAMPKNQFEALKGKAIELGEKSAIKLPEDLEIIVKGDRGYAEKVREQRGVPSGEEVDVGLPKHAQHIKNRGDNYKETLVVVPVKSPYRTSIVSESGGRYTVYAGKTGETFHSAKTFSSLNEAKDYEDYLITTAKSIAPTEKTFTSSHWDEPNVVAHILSSEYQTPQGDKVININETQSDASKEARRIGFATEPYPKEYVDSYREEMSENTKRDIATITDKEVIDYFGLKPKSGLPAHLRPYVENWLDISLTQALKDAVDSGAKYLSWDDGQTVKDRYDLSKVVDRITIVPRTDARTGDVSRAITLDLSGNTVPSYIEFGVNNDGMIDNSTKSDFMGKPLSEAIGKDLAEKIMNEEPKPTTLEGLDLKFGGEWADHLYNRLIPKKLKEMTKKLGGEIVEIEVNDGSKKQALLITPEIIQAVQGGLQPMAGGITRRPKYYRGGGEGSMPKGVTAQEVVDYEVKELGNNIKVENGVDLKQYPSESLQWLSLTKEGAKQFGDVQEKSGNFIVLAKDPDGGVLVASKRTDKPIDMMEEARKYKTAEEFGKTMPDVVEGNFKPNATDKPFQGSFVEGKLYKDSFGDNPYVYRAEYVNPKDFKDTLKLEGRTYKEVVNMPTTQKYIEWYKLGHTPPPIEVVRKAETGKPYASDRRRVVAALESGVDRIPAKVEIGRLIDIWNKAHGSQTEVPQMIESEASIAEAQRKPRGSKPIRFEAGKKLTKEERQQVLRSIGDSYKDLNAPIVEKGVNRHGEIYSGFEYNPEYMYKSDITNKNIRYYITLTDGRKAHPSELYPEINETLIKKYMAEERAITVKNNRSDNLKFLREVSGKINLPAKEALIKKYIPADKQQKWIDEIGKDFSLSRFGEWKLLDMGIPKETVDKILTGELNYKDVPQLTDIWNKAHGVSGGKDFKDLKLFRGSRGKVSEETKSFKNVWENDNQNNLLKELAKDGVKEAGFLVGKYKPNNWVLSDRLIARVAKSRGYDAVMYSNSDRPQLGFEIHDVNEGKFYAEKRELAELYAKQKRDLKHKSVGAAGKDLPTDNIPLEGFPEKLQVKNVDGESVNVTTTPNEKISIDLVQNPDGTVEYELHDGKTVTIPASTAIKLVKRFGKVPTKKVSQATLDKELRDSQRPLSTLAKKLGGLIIEDESSLKGELRRLREFDKNLVRVKTKRSGPTMSLDRHLEAAIEEGLLPRGSDINDYLNSLESEYSEARDFFKSEKAMREAELAYHMGKFESDPFQAEDPNVKQRGFARNVQRTTEDPETIRFLEELKYHVEANADVLKSARKALDDDRNAAIMRVFDPEDKTSEANAIGMLAASDFMKKFGELRNVDNKLAWDNWELATDIIEHVATKGTILGQAIKILSRWITLSPEGALRFALRQKEKFAKKDMNNYIALQKEKDNLRGIKKSEFEYIQEAKKKFGVKLSRKGSEKIYDAAKNLEEQSNAEAKVKKEFARVRDVYRQEVNKLFNLLKNLDTSDPVGAGVYNMLMNQPNLPQYTKKAIKRLAKRSGKLDVKAEVAMGEAEKATHFNNIIALYKEPQFLKNKKLKADIQSIASAVKAFGINDNALTDYESKQFEYLAEAAKTEALRDITLESLQEEAPTRFLDKLFELRASSFLTGPRTHIINNLTQGMMTADNVAREIVSASIDLGREVVSRAWHSVVGGDPYLRERYFGEAAYDVASLISTIPYLGNYVANMLPEMMGRRGFGRLIKEGWIKSWKGLPSESSKVDVVKAPAIKGLKGKIIRSPFHALGAFDSMFYEVNRVASLNALAYRMAAYTSRVDPITGKLVEKKPTRQEIKSRMAEILENPTEEMLEQAHKQSLEMIFRRALGEGTRIVGMLRESQTPLGDMFKYVVPFFHTPIAVPIAFMERSPFPIALMSPRFWKDVKAGGGKRSDAYARHFIGTVLSSALIYWALKEDEKGRPYITAGIPRDEGERELWYRLGIMPYSILKGNKYWSWQRLAPISMQVAYAAAVASLYRNRDKKATDMAIQMAQDMAMSVINQPFVTGVKDVLNFLTDPNRYGGNWIERQATSPIPVIVKQGASALDNTVRRRDGLGDILLGSTPVLSQYVEPQMDLYGRDKKYQGGVAERLFSPFPSSELKNDPVDLELFRLKLYPKAPGQKIRGIKIDDDIYRNFRQRFGEILHTGLSEYIASEDYKELSDEEKRQALDSSFNRLLNQGRQDVLKRHLLRKADELKNEPIKKREEFGQELVDKRIVKDQDELERMMEKLGLENWYPNPPREYLPYEGE